MVQTQTQKICKKHGLTEFSFGKPRRCRKCQTGAVVKYRQLKKIKLVELYGGCCRACSYTKTTSNLHFHHVNPLTKKFSISHGYTRSWEDLIIEANKCILLCSNCHTEIHEGLLDINSYPIVTADIPPKKITVRSVCNCGNYKHKTSIRCSICAKKLQEKISWPPYEELLEMTKETSVLATGRKLGVTDNAVRKRLKNHKP